MNHEELKELYRLDELLHPEGKPWEWWEVASPTAWGQCHEHSPPKFEQDVQYRRKSTALKWDEELSPKEVAECDELSSGYEVDCDADYVGILYCGAEIWNNKDGWDGQKADNEILNHFKKRREAALQEQKPTEEDKIQKAWEDYHGPINPEDGEDYIPPIPFVYRRGYVDGYEQGKKDALNSKHP
jgi:hypothetical protein